MKSFFSFSDCRVVMVIGYPCALTFPFLKRLNSNIFLKKENFNQSLDYRDCRGYPL